MKYRIIVHEDRNPIVRMEVFSNKQSYTDMLSRTHLRMINEGYHLAYTSEDEGQRALTYKWARTAEPMPRIHVSVIHE